MYCGIDALVSLWISGFAFGVFTMSQIIRYIEKRAKQTEGKS